MSVVEQSKVVAEVERHGRGKNRRLRELGISRSTYYWGGGGTGRVVGRVRKELRGPGIACVQKRRQ